MGQFKIKKQLAQARQQRNSRVVNWILNILATLVIWPFKGLKWAVKKTAWMMFLTIFAPIAIYMWAEARHNRMMWIDEGYDGEKTTYTSKGATLKECYYRIYYIFDELANEF